MPRFLPVLSFACAVACAAAGAQEVPMKRRLVLHGIESQSGTVCAETQPVFDEAIEILQEESARPIAITTSADAATGQLPTALMVVDYLAVGDTAAERITVEGFSE